MTRGGGRLAVLLCGAVLALAPSAVFARQAAVEVRFRGEIMPQWEVTPERGVIRVSRGEVFDAAVRISNKSGREAMAMVLAEISPSAGAGYLIHLGCGPTFTLILKPGEAARVPTSYFVAEGTPGDTRALEVGYTVYSFEALRPDPLETGRGIYALRCAACHGALGRGDGAVGRLLNPAVDDLTPALRSKGDGELLAAIRAGVGPMPAFAPVLSESEQRGLLRYLRSLPAGGEAGAVR